MNILTEQSGLHDKTYSPASKIRIDAVRQLSTSFETLPERKQALEDLLRLLGDSNISVRVKVIQALATIFPLIPENRMEEVRERLLNLTAYPEGEVERAAVQGLVSIYPHLLEEDKEKAWKDLTALISSKSSTEGVRRGLARRLSSILPHVPDERKQQAWEDLFELIGAGDGVVREHASSCLGAVYPGLPDSEKEGAWYRLLGLAGAEDKTVREQASRALVEVFPFVPENRRNEAWKWLLKLAASGDEEVRKGALPGLMDAFSHVSDREGAWDGLLRLTSDRTRSVREQAAATIVASIPHMPDKEKVWVDLLKLIGSGDRDVRDTAADSLFLVFPELRDKDGAWKELVRLTEAEDEYVRRKAAETLNRIFPHVSDRKEACADLVRLSGEEDSYVTRRALKVLASIYPELTGEDGVEKLYDLAAEKAVYARRDTVQSLGSALSQEMAKEATKQKETKKEEKKQEEKKQEEKKKEEKIQEETKWGKSGRKTKPGLELLKLTGDRDSYVQKDAAEAIAISFSHLPDKREVCSELLRLSSAITVGTTERKGAVHSLLALYSSGGKGKKRDIWVELLKMTGDSEISIRKDAAEMLEPVFFELENKSGAFTDLVLLTEERDPHVRKKAAKLLGSAFEYAKNRQRAWAELVRLASEDEDREVRKNASRAFAVVFSTVPEKTGAWNDLMQLSGNSDSYVQRAAVRAMGPALYLVRDKTQAWRDMLKLTRKGYIYVRKYAFQSLGKASLWRSLQGEDEVTYLFGLKEGIRYFKEASKIPSDTKIPEFYLPFYESLLFILASGQAFRKAGPESGRYLEKMEWEVKEAGEREKLLKKIEQFAELLRIAGDLDPDDLAGKKELLEGSIRAFDRNLNLFVRAEEEAIFVGKAAKKEYPNLGKTLSERKLKEVLSEIRHKSRLTCLQAKGTPAEELACLVSRKVREWKIKDLDRDRKELDRQLNSLTGVLRARIPPAPENMYIFERLEEVRQEEDLLERYRKTARLVSLLPGVRMPARKVREF